MMIFSLTVSLKRSLYIAENCSTLQYLKAAFSPKLQNIGLLVEVFK